MSSFFSELHRIILTPDAEEKCKATQTLVQSSTIFELDHDSRVEEIPTPGYPPQLNLVAPRELKRRGMQTQEGRNVLMHAVAHIEFNAINLALDAAYRFRNQADEYYLDWIKIASDEARHFGLIRDYLITHGCDYGDLAAHNGLWDMAVKTQHDVVARMALVPRVLEARGLDVTPGMIKRLAGVGDTRAVEILEIIYKDEIGHVKTGSEWFFRQCQLNGLEPRSTFKRMVSKHLHGELKGPFNLAARLQAGFDEIEMQDLENQVL